jgi:RND family efflux transporter MFP subunit
LHAEFKGMSHPGERVSRRASWVLVRRVSLRRFLLAVLVALPVGLGWFRARDDAATMVNGETPPALAARDLAARVEVVRPDAGGIPRSTTQPGSIHAFETVNLVAMVSGYLKTQSVDIGSRVRKGQVLAVIDVPRERQAVAEASSLLNQARAQARQASARVKTASADRDAAAAMLAQTEADVDRLVANRQLAEKQFSRISDLAAREAVERVLVDEQRHDLDSAVAAERTARLAVDTARAKLSGASANLERAGADLEVAEAAVGVAEARLETARVNLAYATITAPFDGVVTHRKFHPGAFVRAATDAGQPPLLTVVRTDLMRVVVLVPDREVVLANPGDAADLVVDALGGRVFRGTVARVAESEDHQSRTMRVEIDLPNPDGSLRDGMYGRATIHLAASSKHLTLPAECVTERSGNGKGAVRVVREGTVRRVAVELGADDGSRVEVVSGLGPDDRVVLRSSRPVEDGSRVVAGERS